MKSLSEIKSRILLSGSSLLEAMTVLDKCSGGVLFVTDPEGHLLGTLTDGDIRRAILKGVTMSGSVDKAMRRDPLVADRNTQAHERLIFMLDHNIHWLPIIDENGLLAGAQTTPDRPFYQELDNEAVIMCGGLGTRLGHLTRACPKPMLIVQGVPILERIMLNLRACGIRNFYFATNYLREQIETHFGDGQKWNVNISYLREKKRMGTGGALSLIEKRPQAPMIIMNGDLLTDLNITHLLNFHISTDAVATMGIVEYSFTNPYGVIRYEDTRLVAIDEKPEQSCFINSGIYIINPEFLDHVPKDTFIDMPTLLLQEKAAGRNVNVYPIYESWLDIGRQSDYDLAQRIPE